MKTWGNRGTCFIEEQVSESQPENDGKTVEFKLTKRLSNGDVWYYDHGKKYWIMGILAQDGNTAYIDIGRWVFVAIDHGLAFEHGDVIPSISLTRFVMMFIIYFFSSHSCYQNLLNHNHQCIDCIDHILLWTGDWCHFFVDYPLVI